MAYDFKNKCGNITPTLPDNCICIDSNNHCAYENNENLISGDDGVHTITLATPTDLDELLVLYRSHIGTSGCTWDENYPNADVLTDDIEQKHLYKMTNHDGVIIAALGAGVEEAHTSMDCWDARIKNACCMFRFVVRPNMQGQGIGTKLFKCVLAVVKNSGFDGAIMLIGPKNYRAIHLYEKCGFNICGTCHMYEADWVCAQCVL